MKKSETNENKNPHVPPIEEVNKDITTILEILEQVNIANLDSNTDITTAFTYAKAGLDQAETALDKF